MTLDAIDPSGRFLNDADTVMTVIDDQNGKRTLEMAQTAPGRYTASFPTPLTGAYHTEFSQKVGGQVVYQQSRGLAVGYPEELRLRPTNTDLLKSVARVSGGIFDPPAESVFTPNDKVALRATPLWPYLLAAAALVFVLDVALRRIDFTLIGWRKNGTRDLGRSGLTLSRPRPRIDGRLPGPRRRPPSARPGRDDRPRSASAPARLPGRWA